MVGAGSFGTAVAVLLVRAGMRTTLLCRTEAQAEELARTHRNDRYLPNVELPRELRIRTFGAPQDQLARADLIFVAVPSKTLPDALDRLAQLEVPPRAGIVSLTKGLVPPDGLSATVALEAAFGSDRVACVGGPSHAREMVETGAGLVCASRWADGRSRREDGHDQRFQGCLVRGFFPDARRRRVGRLRPAEDDHGPRHRGRPRGADMGTRCAQALRIESDS